MSQDMQLKDVLYILKMKSKLCQQCASTWNSIKHHFGHQTNAGK